jgi:hypothetical protein
MVGCVAANARRDTGAAEKRINLTKLNYAPAPSPAILHAVVCRWRAWVHKTIFHENWWLDIVAPGRWDEVTTERAYLRYAYRTKMMFRASLMPPLTRTLGPVVQIEGKKIETRQRAIFTAVGELLDALPDFDRIEFNLDPAYTDTLPFQARGFQTRAQHTFLVDCRQPEATVWSEMRDTTRNKVRRAQESVSIVATDDAASFRTFYAANLNAEKSYFDLRLIDALFAAARARNQARIMSAVDAKGDIHAQTFFIWDAHSYYYFLSSRREAIAHPGAVGALVWEGMRHAQQLGLIFDFDGVTSQARYQFMVGFGGKPATRFIVQKGALLYDAQLEARKFTDRLMGRQPASFY